MLSSQTPELLAPAGNWDCARAAIENGADAIYFGLDIGFNARARAANFHIGELRQLMLMLHRQGVRGYVTLNTLVFTEELQTLEDNVRHLADAGVDAVLVQDFGVARLIRELCPDLAVHASTQMTISNAAAIEMAEQLGVQRVVLARELSIREIGKISAATAMPLEAFVHGALCVAYSGQCLTSESLGGRSANRGQCAQACRLPYEVLCDDQPRDMGDVKYLLSPQDLAAHDLIPQLLDAGVSSFKIEGRLKTPEYVANTCSHYRAAIDAAIAKDTRRLTVEQRRELELSFSRGFSSGWLEGSDHQQLVPGISSAKRGVRLGVLVATRGDELKIDLESPVSTGDGIVLQGNRFEGTEIGGRVYELFEDNEPISHAESGQVVLGMQHGTLNDQGIPAGTVVWKTDDPKLTKRLRQSFEQSDPQKRVPVELRVLLSVDAPVRLNAKVADAAEISITSDHICEAARKHPASTETLREQFSRLGGTVYRLAEMEAEIEGSPMVPLSVLGKLRKKLVAALDSARVTLPLKCSHGPVATRMMNSIDKTTQASPADTAEDIVFRVLCRSLDQLRQAVDCGVRNLIAEFYDLRQYREAVQIARSADANLELATLRVHKPGEDGLFLALAKHGADGWLVRSLAALNFCRKEGIPFACDFSMNVTNPLTAEQLMQWGASRITASYDLNRDQLLELTGNVPTNWLEVVVHQHMPMFHMEHCVFCNVLSPGKNKSDCGRPCDRHEVKLVDRAGAAHVLHADIGCRNTLFNGIAQSGAEAVKPLLAAGVKQLRIELLRDLPAEETRMLIRLYRSLADGELSGTQVWQQLKADNRVGVTRGTLEKPRNPLAIL